MLQLPEWGEDEMTILKIDLKHEFNNISLEQKKILSQLSLSVLQGLGNRGYTWAFVGKHNNLDVG